MGLVRCFIMREAGIAINTENRLTGRRRSDRGIQLSKRHNESVDKSIKIGLGFIILEFMLMEPVAVVIHLQPDKKIEYAAEVHLNKSY
ncbi:hypothetical protein SDC9_159083 [bioreactor metagenome]|uniref:Uncharacterized protein n=1 Tax=bioreactor metagenome TaxID=1076179 RepID=A0A645FBN7_9ZZZZ